MAEPSPVGRSGERQETVWLIERVVEGVPQWLRWRGRDRMEWTTNAAEADRYDWVIAASQMAREIRSYPGIECREVEHMFRVLDVDPPSALPTAPSEDYEPPLVAQGTFTTLAKPGALPPMTWDDDAKVPGGGAGRSNAALDELRRLSEAATAPRCLREAYYPQNEVMPCGLRRDHEGEHEYTYSAHVRDRQRFTDAAVKYVDALLAEERGRV